MSAVERAMAILSRWDAASVPDDLGLHDAGGFAQHNCTEIREALRDLLAALSSPPADDIREAVAETVLSASPPYRLVATYEITDALLAAFEVRPYGTVPDAERYAAALRAIADGDAPAFVREFARDALGDEVRPQGAVTDTEVEAAPWRAIERAIRELRSGQEHAMTQTGTKAALAILDDAMARS